MSHFMYLRSKPHFLHQYSEIPEAMKSTNEEIMLWNVNFMQTGRNLKCLKCSVSLAVTRFAHLAASWLRDLPELLEKIEQLLTGKTATIDASDSPFSLQYIRFEITLKGLNDIFPIFEIQIWTRFHILLNQLKLSGIIGRKWMKKFWAFINDFSPKLLIKFFWKQFWSGNREHVKAPSGETYIRDLIFI